MENKRLWRHQREALATFREYLLRGETRLSALVSMPTGTGKSAVIAHLLAEPECGAGTGSSLVLAPWRGLARQLHEDIDTRCWRNLDSPRPSSLPPVHQVRSASDFIERVQKPETEPAVYVTTMAMAVEILKSAQRDALDMEALFAAFSSVIVDECHYKPAPTWSTAVKATGRPTCLLTATPFRNDNRYFELDGKGNYRYSHEDAVEDRVLREPHFQRLSWHGHEAEFVDALLLRLVELKLKREERVIVRCGSRASVEAVTKALRARGETAVGYHETFEKHLAAKGLYRSVPAPEKRPVAKFWVHQYKLTEGFDDPSIAALAIYEGFGNDRSRIQQVGRILRNPERAQRARAFVLAADDEFESAWRRYRTFDQGDAPRAMATDPAGVEALLKAQPETFYWDRLFRETVDLHKDTAWQHLKYRLSAAVRIPRVSLDLDSLAQSVRDDLVARDRRVLSVGAPDGDSRVLLHLSVENSPILLTGAFVEMTLGYTVLHWDGKRLFVSDTTGGTPKCIRDVTDPVSAASLVGLLPTGARVSEVSLTNNDLGPWSIRSRSLSAPDLDRIASEIGDTTYGYATAQGHLAINGETVTRYTGVKNARVRDRRQTEGRFNDLRTWFAEIGAGLDAKASPARAISRYATPMSPPAKPVARHVLLDIDPGDFEAIEGSSELEIGEFGDEVDQQSEFDVVINGQTVKAHIRWDDTMRRFVVSSGTEVPYRARNGSRAVFWAEITRQQSLRVATDEGLVYTNGTFWSLAAKGRSAKHGLLSLLTTRDELKSVVGEKGPTGTNDRWAADTVFGVVDDVFLPEVLGPAPTILCTDMGREIADFIGFTDSKVIFVHAKSKSADKASRVSASALHEVVSQAIKNLKYLTIGNTDKPNTRTWTEEWGDGSHGTANRLRTGTPSATGADYWKRIDSVVQSHGAEREVWIVLGASLSKDALEKDLAKSAPTAPAVQIYALLNSAWTSAQQCGVRLRVFCS